MTAARWIGVITSIVAALASLVLLTCALWLHDPFNALLGGVLAVSNVIGAHTFWRTA